MGEMKEDYDLSLDGYIFGRVTTTYPKWNAEKLAIEIRFDPIDLTDPNRLTNINTDLT